ncbi:hypothetical protein NIES2119_14055 [[Phormidium ambiguum] IAM M-71]|uniref:Uncharacterized protein n=1 Tax=[Phormidium ambiguum] IAM M-71 TaxID=454136 RepID=A0A1U7IJR8_9CYAN|nr:hypothetical protein [Phormidium ambiguum]OKH37365.1 hypothetical protein NIES2119_14055 [Phormidium ambiguum IAM M-71]
MNNSWQIIGNFKPQELTDSRIKIHYAVQFIAVTSSALVPALPDYSHTSLAWNPVIKMFTGELIQVQTSFRVALDPIYLKLNDTNIKVAEMQKQQVEIFLNSAFKLSKALLTSD